MASEEKIRLSFDIPIELNTVLEQAARDICGTKSEFLRRTIALGISAHEARQEGKIIGVMSQDHKLEKEFIGI